MYYNFLKYEGEIYKKNWLCGLCMAPIEEYERMNFKKCCNSLFEFQLLFADSSNFLSKLSCGA